MKEKSKAGVKLLQHLKKILELQDRIVRLIQVISSIKILWQRNAKICMRGEEGGRSGSLT